MVLGKAERYTHTYTRHGTTNLFAALDVATGSVSASRESAPWSSGGFTVQVKVRVEGVEGRRISLQVEAHHGVDVIGAGTHERVVIQPERLGCTCWTSSPAGKRPPVTRRSAEHLVHAYRVFARALAGLEQVREVHGALTVSQLTALEDLTGLSSLSEVGNNLSLYGHSFVSLDGLQNLTRVGGTFDLASNEKLETLDGSGQVEEVGVLAVSSNPVLTSLSGLARLAHIGAEEFGQGLHLWDNAALKEVGLPALLQVDGSIEITGGAGNL